MGTVLDDELATIRRELEHAATWGFRSRVVFRNLDRQSEVLRAVFSAVTEAFLPSKPQLEERAPWDWLYTDARGALLVESESGNYGLGFVITRYALLMRGTASIRTEDRDFDNCAPEGGEFEVCAVSADALERVIGAIVEWHARNGVADFVRTDG
jgi:hypothetical protein